MQKLQLEDFDKVFELMVESFPSDEYRSYDEQIQLMKNKYYTVYTFYGEDDKLNAFVAVWEFEKFTYIEHIAVSSSLRNSGMGSKILQKIIDATDGMVCLEVEPPEAEMAIRRINFYKRNGFYLNEYPYMQPVLSKGKKSIPLMIMTSGRNVDETEFNNIRDVLYTHVYDLSLMA